MLAISLSYSFIIRSLRRRPDWSHAAVGALFGLLGMIGMLNPSTMSSGLAVNTVPVVLSVVAAVSSPWSAVLSAILVLAMEAHLHTVNATSVAMVLMPVSLGLLYRRGGASLSKPWQAYALGVFAVTSQGLSVGMMFLLQARASPLLEAEAVAVWGVHALAAWVLARIVLDAQDRLISENALRMHEARLRATVNAIPDLLCLLSRDGHFVEVLSGPDGNFALPHASLQGQSLHQLLPPDEADRLVEQISNTLQSDQTLNFEYELPFPGGVRRFEGRTHALDGDHGDEPLVVLLARDVTHRHAAAEALRTSELRFRSLLQNMDAVAVQGFSPDGRISYWNRACESLYGYPAQDVLGHNYLDVLVPAENRRDMKDLLDRMLAGQESLAPREMYLLHRSGREIPVLSGHAMVDAGGGQKECFRFDIDLTERKRTEAELRVAATAFEAQEGMMVTDAQRKILRVNQAFTRISGYEDSEVIGQTPTMFSSGWHDNAFYESMNLSLATTGTWEGEMWNRRKNGEIQPQWLHITAVTDESGAVTHFVATATDITQRKAAEDQIRQLAFYDPLTGLPNRRMLLDRLRYALASSARSQRWGALLFIDLDHFKTLNDTLGHDKGDMLLQQVAHRIQDTVREEDTVARLGGDEYVVMLEGLDSEREAAALQATSVGEKIIAKLNWPYQLAGHEYHSTPSMGLTLFSGHEVEVDELLKQADLAMYQAKSAGRNALRFFDPEMQRAVTQRAELESDLRLAILYAQFELYYQAQVDASGRVIGAEGLLRWHHPTRGMVSPAEFIPVAEESGQILPLGSWVLEAACAQLVDWARDPESADLTLAVNVSARQFKQQDFAEHVLGLLDYTGANPTRLKLELTESLLADNLDDVIVKMSALRARGVGFSLDDFGTGYSSLAYLKRLPLDQLKIDQGFVRDVLTDPNDSAIVKTILALGNTLGMKVIAEGVETLAQKEFLMENGCNSFQGYWFSRPLSAQDFMVYVHGRQGAHTP